MDEPTGPEAIQLIISDNVRARMEERLILVEDLRRAIARAEKTGYKFSNRQTGHFLASFRPTNVTYWVEYSVQGDAFVVHNTYSHRMQVAGEQPT